MNLLLFSFPSYFPKQFKLSLLILLREASILDLRKKIF